ncbi:MAG TPA: M23 family metallopeptidase [Candidatus Dormibacteraeota bacterium]|jgi:murein DD-endopeptidase MepM/ murein hydrolase activator NlpD|nr:M23 family metallopeptidase [Candidatus Dormibacteraeota bacterium]
MTALRGMAVFGIAGLVWVVVAAQIPSHARLALSGVVTGAVISQPYGCTELDLEPYDPFCPGRHIHTGIDLAAHVGSPVHSATAGTAHVGFDPAGAGRYVVVTIDPHVRIFYCHLSAVLVANGQAVIEGQVLGALGMSGRATGPHLHFEVQRDGTSIDPVAWLAS